MADAPENPLDPSSWYATPDICGSCIAWRPTGSDPDAEVASGICKLRPELRSVPATMAKCAIYKARGQFKYSPEQASSPKRRRNKVLKVVRMNEAGEMVRTSIPRAKPASRTREHISPATSTLPREIDFSTDISASQVRQALSSMIRSEINSGAPSMHAKFEGGRVEIQNAKTESQDFPAELLFAQLAKFQDSLAVLQSQLDRHATKLGEKTSEDLLNYLKRARGTMTTFNVMFQDKADFFSSK